MASSPTISVRRHPFASPEGHYLVSLLDADLASLYPDWDDLSHPGMHHENNPRPPAPLKHPGTNEESNQSRLSSSQQPRNGPVRVAELKAANAALEEEEGSAGLVFFVAFRASASANDGVEEPIGCGALRLFIPTPTKPLPSQLDPKLKYAEVKRMYVHPSARGLGISKLLLAELENCAREKLGLDVILMETGRRQEPAVKLYEGSGYVRRGMFGEYVGADVESGGDSICLEKTLR